MPPTPPPSILLFDAILLALSDGETTSARKVSRIVGEDQARILAHLHRFRADGLVRSRTIHPPSNQQEKPYEVFTPNIAKINALIATRRKEPK